MQCTVTWSPEAGAVTKQLASPEVYPAGHSLVWKKKMEDAVVDPREERARKKERARELRRQQQQKAVSCCKKFVAFLFSHIGLAGMVVAYSIMGGFLFQALEAPNEAAEKLRILRQKEEQVSTIWQLADNLADTNHNKTLFEAQVREVLTEFQKQVVLAVKEKGWDGEDDTSQSALQWSFAGALLYAVTVITTIGKSYFLVGCACSSITVPVQVYCWGRLLNGLSNIRFPWCVVVITVGYVRMGKPHGSLSVYNIVFISK